MRKTIGRGAKNFTKICVAQSFRLNCASSWDGLRPVRELQLQLDMVSSWIDVRWMLFCLSKNSQSVGEGKIPCSTDHSELLSVLMSNVPCLYTETTGICCCVESQINNIKCWMCKVFDGDDEALSSANDSGSVLGALGECPVEYECSPFWSHHLLIIWARSAWLLDVQRQGEPRWRLGLRLAVVSHGWEQGQENHRERGYNDRATEDDSGEHGARKMAPIEGDRFKFQGVMWIGLCAVLYTFIEKVGSTCSSFFWFAPNPL